MAVSVRDLHVVQDLYHQPDRPSNQFSPKDTPCRPVSIHTSGYTPPDTHLHLSHPLPLTLHQISITLRPTTLANSTLPGTHLPLRHRDLARIVPNWIGPPALGLEASHERLAGGPRDGDVYAAVPEALEREDERRYVVEGEGDGVWVHEGVDAVGC
jgi:hypothetical protein